MNRHKIAIVGGGISGLACAFRLNELANEKHIPLHIKLIEGEDRLGGTIETKIRDGFVLEKGPDSFISEKPWCLALVKRLGIENDVIGTRSEFRKSFVVRKKKLHPLPDGFYLTAPTNFSSFLKSEIFSPWGKIRTALEWFVPRGQSDLEESLGAFIRRRFGSEMLDRVAQAMIAGIHTGDPETLSLVATMPRFKDLESEYGSVIRGLLESAKKRKSFKEASGPRYSLFLSFKNGMETLIHALERKIPNFQIQKNTFLGQVRYDSAQKNWKLEYGEEIETFDAVCVATSAHVAAKILNSQESLARELEKIRYQSVATINFAFRKSDIGHPLDGFGFVVPRIENSPLVACSFSSMKYENRAPNDLVLLRAFVGGAFGSQYLAMDDQDLEETTLTALGELLSISAQPIFTETKRYVDSMVQYEVGHQVRILQIQNEVTNLPGLFLTGSAYRGVGIADCIHDAELQAEAIFKYLQYSTDELFPNVSIGNQDSRFPFSRE